MRKVDRPHNKIRPSECLSGVDSPELIGQDMPWVGACSSSVKSRLRRVFPSKMGSTDQCDWEGALPKTEREFSTQSTLHAR